MKYHEHDRLRAIRDKSQAAGEFMDMLEEHNIFLCEFVDGPAGIGGYVRTPMRREQVLAKVFDIDLELLEAEKRSMLAEQRALVSEPGT